MSTRRFLNTDSVTWRFPEGNVAPGEEIDVDMPDGQPCPLHLTEITEPKTKPETKRKGAITEPGLRAGVTEPNPTNTFTEN